MRNVTKDNITDAFMGYLGDDTDPRLREVLGVAGARICMLSPKR